jgi:hypothetical protein
MNWGDRFSQHELRQSYYCGYTQGGPGCLLIYLRLALRLDKLERFEMGRRRMHVFLWGTPPRKAGGGESGVVVVVVASSAIESRSEAFHRPQFRSDPADRPSVSRCKMKPMHVHYH